jgi:hypothetical protein
MQPDFDGGEMRRRMDNIVQEQSHEDESEQAGVLRPALIVESPTQRGISRQDRRLYIIVATVIVLVTALQLVVLF